MSIFDLALPTADSSIRRIIARAMGIKHQSETDTNEAQPLHSKHWAPSILPRKVESFESMPPTKEARPKLTQGRAGGKQKQNSKDYCMTVHDQRPGHLIPKESIP
eukprot:scaffold33646_cov142-Skeletonema_dohrnii-CCMP3373.AAC.2